MEKFAEYGFNKSHAAAYALVAYQTAWLKANHPVAFLAASMTLDADKTEKLAAHIQEATRLGIAVLPPDINRSGADFLVETGPDGRPAIRFALSAVKKVGLKAMQELVAARDRPFADLADFAARIDPKLLNKMQIENLARAGAFDGLEPNRARVFHGAETILRRAQAAAEERASGQIGLFGQTAAREPLRLPEMADWPELERLAQEAEAIGFHLSAHPLDAYRPVLKRLGVVPSSAIADRRRRRGTAEAGGHGDRQQGAQHPHRAAAWRVTLSDGAGRFEVTFFSETLSRCRDILAEGNAVLVTADARLEGEALRLTAQDAEPLDKAAADLGQELRIGVDSCRGRAGDPRASCLPSAGAGADRAAAAAGPGPGGRRSCCRSAWRWRRNSPRR